MTSLLVRNIGQLVLNDPVFANLNEISGAAMVIEGETIAWVGPNASAPSCDEVLDVAGACVIPGFVDSHSHLVFAGERSLEFSSRMTGEKYSAGGIKTTVAKTREATKEQLSLNAQNLLREMHSTGTTTAEIKSGYGLNVETEKRILEVASELTQETTFLGAHVVPEGISSKDYVNLVTGEMLEAVLPFAKWIDVFCDKGAFDAEQSREVLSAGIAKGLLPRIHANQQSNLGAIALAVELDCASADHCTHLSSQDIELLAGSNTVATLLPGAEFSTRSPYPNARGLIEAGAKIALATDCNPGSSFTSSMPFVIALAVTQMGLSPAEALWAATMGGANALRRKDVGHLNVGASADFVVLDAPNHIYLSYRPGVQLVSKTYKNGKKIFERQN
jgi:imidazolonepropionase